MKNVKMTSPTELMIDSRFIVQVSYFISLMQSLYARVICLKITLVGP